MRKQPTSAVRSILLLSSPPLELVSFLPAPCVALQSCTVFAVPRLVGSFVDTIGLLAAPSLAKAIARRFCAPSSVYDVLLSAEAQVHSGGISGDEVVRRILIF